MSRLQPSMSQVGSGRTAARAVLLAVLAVLAAPCNAQSHETVRGGYVLRSDLVPSTAVDPQAAARQGITRDAHHAILNVMVHARGHAAGVPAEVRASVRPLGRARESVELHEVRANGSVTYLGVLAVARGEVDDISIHAQPRGRRGPQLALKYRSRLRP